MMKRFAWVFFSAHSLGCASSPSGAAETTGSVSVAVEEVPADALCVRLKAESSSTTTRSFDTTPGDATTWTLREIPIGDVSFSASAFDVACASVSSTSIPTWVADPVVATVTSGTAVPVALTMHRNGGASVSIDFSGDVTPPTFAGVTNVTGAGTGMLVVWTAATDDVSPPESIVYDVCYATSATECTSSFNPMLTSPPGDTFMYVSEATIDETYYVVVRARDQAGNRDDNTVELSYTIN